MCVLWAVVVDHRNGQVQESRPRITTIEMVKAKDSLPVDHGQRIAQPLSTSALMNHIRRSGFTCPQTKVLQL